MPFLGLRHILQKSYESLKREMALVSFTPWIFAQGLGRINLFCRSSKVFNICLCYSPIHVLINIADPSVTSQGTFFFPGIFASRLIAVVEALGFNSEPLSNQSFILALVSSVSRGHRFIVWVPHLGPDDLPPFVRQVIRELEPLQAVRYIDDGFGFLARDTLIYEKKYISPDATIYSWDFKVPLSEMGMPPVVVRSCFQRAIKIVMTTYPYLLNQGLGQISCQMQQKCPTPVSIVLASKLLDVDFCLRKIASCAKSCQSFYVPHYNVLKNYAPLARALASLPLEVPEFGLLGIALSMPCRIFFGLTSSIIILIELLLRFDFAHSVELVYAVDRLRTDPRSSQLDSFNTILTRYQKLDGFRHRSINIVFE
jgi:hypothetical protein